MDFDPTGSWWNKLLLQKGPHRGLLSTLPLKGGLFENKLAQTNLTTPSWEPGTRLVGG